MSSFKIGVKGSRNQGLGQERVRARVNKAVGVREASKRRLERQWEEMRVQGTTGLSA